MNYKQAGVDIEAGNRFVEYIKRHANVGSFSSHMQIGKKNVLTTCDGVGTKILIAKHFDYYSTIGIDLVAMCVNDLLASGAIPISFLDYIACGKITNKLEKVMSGIIEGCAQAECELAGGETAEMPDMYKKDDIDLAGFAVGVADVVLPRKDCIEKGDYIIGIPSSGIHSNGISLARKVLDKEDWQELLVPTKIYVKEMKEILKKRYVYAAAHITGGGFDNIRRIIPDKVDFKLYNDWHIPQIFSTIAAKANMPYEEMIKIFNMGIGMAIIVAKRKVNKLNFPVIGEII